MHAAHEHGDSRLDILKGLYPNATEPAPDSPELRAELIDLGFDPEEIEATFSQESA